jgi:hypothetical protein
VDLLGELQVGELFSERSDTRSEYAASPLKSFRFKLLSPLNLRARASLSFASLLLYFVSSLLRSFTNAERMPKIFNRQSFYFHQLVRLVKVFLLLHRGKLSLRGTPIGGASTIRIAKSRQGCPSRASWRYAAGSTLEDGEMNFLLLRKLNAETQRGAEKRREESTMFRLLRENQAAAPGFSPVS